MVSQVLDYYQKYNNEGERLGEIINREGMNFFKKNMGFDLDQGNFV